MVDKFKYLSIGVSVLLIFVGLKLLFHSWLDNMGFKPAYSLYVIAMVLVLSMVLSMLIPSREVRAMKRKA